jgi:hypothetical protein
MMVRGGGRSEKMMNVCTCVGLEKDVSLDKIAFSVATRTNVETNGGDGGHDLAQLELVKHSGLSSSIESNHEDTHLLFAEALE